MKKILFLDDDDMRRSLFHQWTKDQYLAVDFAKTAKEAQKFLFYTKYAVAFLDHDLSVQDQMCKPGYSVEPSGSFLTKWMAKYLKDEQLPEAVVVHSFNAVGAQQMIEDLAGRGIQAVRSPFGPGLKEYIP